MFFNRTKSENNKIQKYISNSDFQFLINNIFNTFVNI